MKERLNLWKYLKNNHPYSTGVILFALIFIVAGLFTYVYATIWGAFVLIVFVVACLLDVRKINKIKNSQKKWEN